MRMNKIYWSLAITTPLHSNIIDY